MDDEIKSKNGIKGFLKYISTVVSWTAFVLLFTIGILLAYYYVSVKLYAFKGEKYEPFFSIYSVASGSMEPTISYLDLIVNLKIDSIDDVKVNDVITFVSAWDVNYGMTMTHRVVGTSTTDDGRKCLITKGDWNTQEDQVCVTEENVIGVVKAVVPGFGKIQKFLSSRLGWLLIVIIPALYVIVKDIIKIISIALDKDGKYTNNKKDNDDKKKDKNKDDIDLESKLEKAYEDLEKVRTK